MAKSIAKRLPSGLTFHREIAKGYAECYVRFVSATLDEQLHPKVLEILQNTMFDSFIAGYKTRSLLDADEKD